MDRRSFMAAALAAGATVGTALSAAAPEKSPSSPFKLKYAPSLGRFKHLAGEDPLDQSRFMHDQGFRAIFDNGLMDKAPALQETIAAALRQRQMDLGPFVGYADFKTESFVLAPSEIRDEMLKKHGMMLGYRGKERESSFDAPPDFIAEELRDSGGIA